MSEPRLREPVFVIGSPRSGTTLLRLMLTCHPEVVVPPECGFAVWFAQGFPRWTSADVPRFVASVVGAKKFDTWGISRLELQRWLEEHPVPTYADACAQVYMLYAARSDRRPSRWGDKNNFHVHRIRELHELWPRATFVHIVRDGRDVACSYREVAQGEHRSAYRPSLPTEPRAIAEQWVANVTEVLGALEAIGTPRVLQVRFDELVRAPEHTLGKLCEALGLPWSPLMLTYPEANRRGGLEPAEMLSWKRRTLQPPDEAAVGRHRRDLTPAQRGAFEAVAGDLLGRLGFTMEVS